MKTVLALAFTIAVALPAVAQQQPDPNSPRYKGVVALSGFLASSGDEALQQFIDDRIAASIRESMSDADLMSALDEMRAETKGAEMRGGRPSGELAAELVMGHADGSELAVAFELDPGDVDRFAMISTPGSTIGG